MERLERHFLDMIPINRVQSNRVVHQSPVKKWQRLMITKSAMFIDQSPTFYKANNGSSIADAVMVGKTNADAAAWKQSDLQSKKIENFLMGFFDYGWHLRDEIVQLVCNSGLVSDKLVEIMGRLGDSNRNRVPGPVADDGLFVRAKGEDYIACEGKKVFESKG